MDNRSLEPAQVATWARVLAWVIVAASVVAVVGVAVGAISGRPLPPVPWYIAAFFVLATVWVLPLFWIVAIRGRPPKYWLGLGSHHWRVE